MKRHAAISIALFVLGACTTETVTTEYVDKPLYHPPPDASSGFVGYYTVSDKKTTCGNCHVGHQADWKTTAHSRAWSDLQSSGHATASCYNCHAVSQLGNSLGKPGGYGVVADTAYHDVQCENCHGPAYTHVQNPEVIANQPLASIVADTGIANGCSGCHTGVHEPYVDEWIQSAHGSGTALSHAAGNATCTPCHEGQAALTVKFGVTSNFKEKGSTTPLHIVCVVCHDPHGTAGFDGQLRASMSVPTVDNLCVKCHSRSATPPWGAASPTRGAGGPHGAQGLLVIGQAGWIPPNFTYDTGQIISSHGTEANPRLCATCHVARTTVTDAETGAFQFQSVGHLFDAIPCLVNGIPTPGACAQSERDFTSGCVASGCHATASSAMSAYNANISVINVLLDQIWVDNNANAIVDASPTDGGLLAQMVARGSHQDSVDLDFGNTITSVAKGTIYNAALAATDDRAYFLGGKVFGKSWAAHASSGNGVHNPFLLQALLAQSITALHQSTGFPVPPNADLRVRATPPPGVVSRVSVR
jgi:predicted CXXCH cytochrome family protein